MDFVRVGCVPFVETTGFAAHVEMLQLAVSALHTGTGSIVAFKRIAAGPSLVCASIERPWCTLLTRKADLVCTPASVEYVRMHMCPWLQVGPTFVSSSIYVRSKKNVTFA